MRVAIVAGLLLLVRAAWAHDVPVDPGACDLDTLRLDDAAAGSPVVVAPAGGTDRVRVVYDTATSTAQFQPLQRPRGPSAAGDAIALPAAFDAALTAGGDLRAERVALDVTAGGVRARVPVTLTTGLLVVPGAIVAGRPIDQAGRFLLVGAVPSGALPGVLDGVAVARVGCRLEPVPALDRFAPAPVIDGLAGTLGPGRGSLRGVLRDAPALATFAEGAALLEIRVAGRTAAALSLPAGFAGSGGRRAGESIDGSRVTLRRGPQSGTLRLRVDLETVALSGTPAGPVEVEVTLASGATTARGRRTFRARGGRVRSGA